MSECLSHCYGIYHKDGECEHKNEELQTRFYLSTPAQSHGNPFYYGAPFLKLKNKNNTTASSGHSQNYT
jgi:hypothetical protein